MNTVSVFVMKLSCDDAELHGDLISHQLPFLLIVLKNVEIKLFSEVCFCVLFQLINVCD